MSVVKFIMENWQQIFEAVVVILVAIVALVKAVIAIALIIPGDQPEKALQSVVDFLQKGVDFLAKFSKKPKTE